MRTKREQEQGAFPSADGHTIRQGERYTMHLVDSTGEIRTYTGTVNASGVLIGKGFALMTDTLHMSKDKAIESRLNVLVRELRFTADERSRTTILSTIKAIAEYALR